MAVMRPYYEQAGVTIYHGDCREVVPQLQPGLIVTDPPYNVGYHYDQHDDSMSDKDYWAFVLSAVMVPLVFLHYPEAIFPLARGLQMDPDKVIAWVYHANTPKQWRAIAWFGMTPDLSLDGQAYRNSDDRRVRELIDAGHQARLYDWWMVEQVKNISSEKTQHPCQIPLALMMRILRITPFDGPVIDPFLGSGTTLLAAKELGRTAIGVEMSEQYCEIAARRLMQDTLPLEHTA